MKRTLPITRTAVLWLCAAASLIPAWGAVAQVESELIADSRLVGADGPRLPSLDAHGVTVRDLGTIVPMRGLHGIDSVATASDNATLERRAEQDTLRYTLLPRGVPGGERAVWWEAPDVRRHRLEYQGRVLETRTVLDGAGLPIRMETTGTHPMGAPWEERFELRMDTAEWFTPVEQGSRLLSGSAFYTSLEYESTFELPLLARALYGRAGHTAPLLPDGEARLEDLGRRNVEAEGRKRAVVHYAIHGLDLAPEYIWLNEDGSLFADEISILAGWESVYPELIAASADALVEHGHDILGELTPPSRERPLVIRGARLFDPESHSMHENTTIVVEGRRIAAVGPDGSVDLPNGAEVLDAAGRAVLPGLWDMHVHIHPGFIEELDAPLFVAAGVTTVRDLGSETDLLVSLRHRVDSGAAIGPRILPALIVYGPGQSPIGVNVGTADEARAAVDRFAALGYVQVKLYNPVPVDLVPAIIERARHHGMRVSGHIPNRMTGRDVIESGFDEVQHLFYARIGAAGLRLGTDQDVGARMAAVRPNSDEWREFVRLLVSRGTVVDPSLAVVEETVGGRPPLWLGKVVERFPAQAGRMASHHVGPSAPPPFLVDDWDEIVANGPDLVRSLYEAGVPLVAGTDAQIGGFELHRELELYVEAGIPETEVLRMATLGAARVMSMGDELGSVEPGKLADLILVDGDPTTDISDIRRVVRVVKDGRVYDPAAIYRALGIAPCCAE